MGERLFVSPPASVVWSVFMNGKTFLEVIYVTGWSFP